LTICLANAVTCATASSAVVNVSPTFNAML
jgi:hypothetical protein